MTAARTAVKASARAEQGGPYRVQVLDRMLSILDLLAQSDSDLGPSELGEKLSLHRSTTHRLLKVLERHQLIRKSPLEGRYGLGIKLFELGSRVVSQFDLASRSQPFLRRLVDVAGETAHVCVLNDAEMVSVANVEGPWTLRTPSTVGRRTPLYCTSVGKVVLAYLPTAEQSHLLDRVQLVRRTKRTTTSRPALEAELQVIRRRGFGMDNEEIEEGLRCIGAPIFNHRGEIAAAISVAGPVFRVTRQRLPEIVRAVKTAGRDLSHDLGYRPSSQP
ncbi:MAG: IclR family transcriptional regulator [Vicinamibacterales bacterium]